MILTYKDLSERWGIPIATLRKHLERGKLPPPDRRVGQSPVWNEDTIAAMEDSHATTTGVG